MCGDWIIVLLFSITIATSDYNCCNATCLSYFTPKELEDIKQLQKKMSMKQQRQFILTSMHLSTMKTWKEAKFSLLVSLNSSFQVSAMLVVYIHVLENLIHTL